MVLDASVAVAWCFQNEATSFTEAVLDLLIKGIPAQVPAIWPLEVANATLSAERGKKITTAHATSFLRQLEDLPISVDPIPSTIAFNQILPLARQQSLTEYDASYLELAIRNSLPIATLDQNLRRAARRIGVKLVEP